MKKSNTAKRAVSAVLAASALCGTVAWASELNGTKEILCKVGDNLTVSDNAENAAETQKLIDQKMQMQRTMENLDRGLVAVTTDNGVFVSWRWLGYESINTKYNLYRNGVKVNAVPMSLTNYTDIDGAETDKYSLAPVTDGAEGEKCDEVSVWKGYKEIKLQRPEPMPIDNSAGEYKPNDASVGDLDGDGELEIVLKWESKVLDAGKSGTTNNTYIDAYKLDGTRLWRIDMGKNIRSGPHDTQFIVGDFDGDGKAEMAVRTADGTVAGDGTVIGDGEKDWRAGSGKNIDGPLYTTVFKGTDGSVIDSIPFFTQSTGTYSDGTEWNIESWGDNWGNRSERYLGGYACFDGVHTSFVQSRGYYDRTCIGAYHLENGKIVTDFEFDSEDPKYKAEDGTYPYNGQGYHNLSVADVDYDGKDELIFGHLVLDDNGEPLYTTNLGHGDAIHVGDFVLSNPGLEVYTCQEQKSKPYGFVMRDARTGKILYGLNTGTDNGRACAGDIDPAYEGSEAWSAYGVLTSADGTVISTTYSMPTNATIYWDGDLGKELVDGNAVYKWDSGKDGIDAIFKATGTHSNNSAKSNPCLQADIFGDWREELIFAADDMESLRIYTTDAPTAYRIPTLMHNWEYRDAIGWQNVCYNQPPHVGYNLGYDTTKVPVPDVSVTTLDGAKHTNPDYSKKNYSIDELYFGETVELVPDCSTALINGLKVMVDSDNADVKPYINSDSRTMVPLRFISEAFGAEVEWYEAAKQAIISYGNDVIALNLNDNKMNINGEIIEMDTVSVIKNDRTFVPLRAVAEMLDKNVNYYDGLIYISDIVSGLGEAEAANRKEIISKTKSPTEVEHSEKSEDYSDKDSGLRVDIVAAGVLEELDYGEPTNDFMGEDAASTIDFDVKTGVTVPAGGCLTIDNGNYAGVPAVVLAFGDDKVHNFRIDYSSDGKKWQIGVADRFSAGQEGVYEKYYFGCPLYPRYVRYISLDGEDTVITEFAQAKVN